MATGEYRLGPVTGKLDAARDRVRPRRGAAASSTLPIAKGATPAERREDLVLVVADATLAGTLDDTTGTAGQRARTSR